MRRIIIFLVLANFVAVRLFFVQGCSTLAGAFAGSCILAWYPEQGVKESIVTKSGFFAGLSPAKTSWSTAMRAIGRPAAFFAIVGSSFAFTECLAEDFRGHADSWNAMIGGMVAGAVAASPRRRLDVMAGAALGVGILMFGVDYCGPSYSEEAAKRQEIKQTGTRPLAYQDSERVKALKEMYPDHQKYITKN